MTIEKMSQESKIVLPKPIWVCGITHIQPYTDKIPNERYVFFELDSDKEEYKIEVLKGYADRNIPVLYQKVRRGFHFWGGLFSMKINQEFQRSFSHLNLDGSLNTTLRIKRKTDNEVFEMPQYQGPEPIPNWAKALRYFLTLEYRRQITDYDQTAKKCGLYKYWKPQKGHSVIFYPLCHICLTALPTKEDNKLKHYQDVHRMFIGVN